MPDYALYRLKITTLTPLHIGCGVTLLHEYDYAIHAGRTWRIDDAAFLEAQSTDDPAFVDLLAATPPARLLKDEDFRLDSPFFRYVIQGTPRSQAEGAQVEEQLKDAFDRPYLPGSSLKGALRTALGWQLWKDLGLKPDMRLLNRSPKWAAQNIERQMFGESPNTDSLRALHVSDSHAVGSDRLMVLNARVLAKNGSLGSPIELEAIRPETAFEMEAKLDLALFNEWARRHRLQLTGRGALESLPAIVNARSLLRARQEAVWFQNVPGANRVLGFYQQLERIQPAPNQFVLQLGWGTGWDDKTFGSRLTQDQGFLTTLIREYHLKRGPGRGPARVEGGIFPSSRRVAVAYRRDARENVVETPAYPLGWVLVEFEEVGPAKGVWSKAAERAKAAPPAVEPPAPSPARPTEAPRPQPRPAQAERPAGPPARPQPRPAEPTPPAVLTEFKDRPKPGDRFRGEVYQGDSLTYVTLLNLRDDLWTGIIPAPARRLREGETVLCEVVAVKPDPNKKGAWLVECRMA